MAKLTLHTSSAVQLD